MIPPTDLLWRTAVRTALAIPVTGDSKTLPAIAALKLRAAISGVSVDTLIENAHPADAVVKVVKTAVSPGKLDGTTWGSQLDSVLEVAANGYFESLRSPGGSVFFRLLGDGFNRTPLRTRVAIATASATAYIRREGQIRALTSFALENSTGLEPVEAIAIVVVTEELLRLTTPAAQAMLERELRNAVSAVVDSEFLAIATTAAGGTLTASGTTIAAASSDFARMLGQINVGQNSKLIWIGPASIAKSLAAGLGENSLQYPNMSPSGGSLLGIPFAVTDQITDGRLFLVDASKFAADGETIRLEIIKHATLQMSTTPDSPETASSTLLSLWQENRLGLAARVYFGIDDIRANGVSILSGIDWGSPPDSPA